MICAVVFISSTILHKTICNISLKCSRFTTCVHVKKITVEYQFIVKDDNLIPSFFALRF